MSRLTRYAAIGVAALVTTASAQQSNPLQSASAALGADKIKTLQFTGSGASFVVGQAYVAGEAWPRLNVNSYVATIDYDTGSMRLEVVRTMPDPIPPGGGGAFQGEQRQVQAVSGTYAWNVPQPAAGATTPAPAPAPQAPAVVAERKLQILSTPQGFVKAALANNATTKRAGNATEVSFVVDEKYRVAGRLNAQNQVERVETWIDNPVMGDMPVVTTYSGYRDFGGVTFPARIQQTQGGHPSLDLTISAVQANPAADIAVPDSVRSPAIPPAPIQVASQQIAPGIYYLTGGSHHSVAIEMRDHVVVIEGPQTEARGLAVIAKTKEIIPNKPIRFVVNTHVHFDHSGGLRPFVEDGATVVTHRSNQAFYEKAWAAPRTINPDRLAQSKRRPQFQALSDRSQLTDGSRTIEIHLIANNRHNTGVIMAWLPAEKILIEADAYSPTAANVPPPATPNPFSVALADNIQRLKLDVGQILALHGPRVATLADLHKAIGRSGSE
jgi:glyoxylase-like metal-dependent hydrolase (beta-lactamase superfamily II)